MGNAPFYCDGMCFVIMGDEVMSVKKVYKIPIHGSDVEFTEEEVFTLLCELLRIVPMPPNMLINARRYDNLHRIKEYLKVRELKPPAINDIVVHTGLSRATVVRALTRLIQTGEVEKEVLNYYPPEFINAYIYKLKNTEEKVTT